MAQAPHHDGEPKAGDSWRLISPSGVLDLGEAPARRPLHDLDALGRGLADRARDWVPRLFPAGRLVDGEWRLADISGRAARKHGSCVIALAGADAGCWYDFALGRGGGSLDTFAHATGLSGRPLFETAAAEVGTNALPRSVLPRSTARPRPCHPRDPDDLAREIAFIISGCLPAVGTLAETYLASRELPCPAAADLFFHPALTHYGSRSAWPAMVAVVRSGAGQPIGLHRTYLARDGSGKAPLPKPKMMLGEVLGGAVRLRQTQAGRLGVAEGIETAIAAAILFGIPVWATLSTAGMRAFVPPAGIVELVVFADAGEAGESAAADLVARMMTGGLAVRCGEIDVAALAGVRDQLWAEAVHRFRAGEPWWLDDRDLVEAAAVEQSARLQRDAWEERIRDWCETETITDEHGYGPPTLRRVPRREPIRDTTMSELLGAALGIEIGRWNRGDQQRVAAILTAAGWQRYQRRDGERREWRWRRNPATT